jgi:hypothetical protein
LVVQVKLLPTPVQASALEATLRACNSAASQVAVVARKSGVYRNYDLRKHVYEGIKDDYRLGAQAAQHVIKKVCDAYKTLRVNIRAGNLGKPGSKRRCADDRPGRVPRRGHGYREHRLRLRRQPVHRQQAQRLPPAATAAAEAVAGQGHQVGPAAAGPASP